MLLNLIQETDYCYHHLP